MSSIVQLNEMIPVETKIGKGYAMIFETGEHDNYWTVAMNNGAIVTFRQEEIKISRSYTHGRCVSNREMKEIIKC